MKILTVTGYKGGVGKSTTALHVATFLSERGDVVLVDGDPNRTSLSWAARGSIPFPVVDQANSVRAVQNRDFVVIDTPARPDSSDLKDLAEGCDLLILPTTPDVVSLEPMLQTANDLNEAQSKALLTIVPPHPSKEGEAMRSELEENGVPVFQSMIRRTAGFQKAALSGVPIRDLNDSRMRIAWNDYVQLGQEIWEVLHG